MKQEDKDAVVEMLKGVDGNTFESIIREVGMEYQMLRQLVMMAPTYMLEDLIEDKMSMDDETVHLRRDDAKEEWDFLDDNSALIPEDFWVD